MDRARARRQIESLQRLERTRNERVAALESARLDREIYEYQLRVARKLHDLVAKLEAEEVRP